MHIRSPPQPVDQIKPNTTVCVSSSSIKSPRLCGAPQLLLLQVPLCLTFQTNSQILINLFFSSSHHPTMQLDLSYVLTYLLNYVLTHSLTLWLTHPHSTTFYPINLSVCSSISTTLLSVHESLCFGVWWSIKYDAHVLTSK